MQQNSVWDYYRLCKGTGHFPMVASPGYLPPLKKIQQKQYYKIQRDEHKKIVEKHTASRLSSHAVAGFEKCQIFTGQTKSILN